jgi:hypothetical protein
MKGWDDITERERAVFRRHLGLSDGS